MAAALPQRFAALPGWLEAELGANNAEITAFQPLSGGAIQENWLLDAVLIGGPHDGAHEWVLRTDAASAIATSHSRAEEFAILKAAHGAGVRAPKPVCLSADGSITGAPFFLMERARGTAQGRKIIRDGGLASFGPALARSLGEELARLHAVKPACPGLDFLPVPQIHPALFRIRRYRADLDALPGGHPVLEFALNWLEDCQPPENGLSLCHTDYRTGNYMVDAGQLTAILDWEFTSWSDPDEDIGWFFARCWRFGNDALTAGGISQAGPFLEGYERISRRTVNRQGLRYWQVMAELRWAIIALQQGERCNSGAEVTQELALSGIMPPEMELNMLNLIDSFGKPS